MSEHFFRSSGYLADSRISGSDGGEFQVDELPPFLRTLLVTDGTVTKSLEAWFWEPVVVTPRQQHRQVLDAPLESLSAGAGDELLRREVCLTGKDSGRDYACARSLLRLAALPEGMRAGMLEGRIGIGELLREQGVETYREIIMLDYLRRGRHQDALLRQFDDDLVSRSYRIQVSGEPAILVTEYFPVSVYGGNRGE